MGNLTVDGLLCFLNSHNYENLVLNNFYPNGSISNPYYGADNNFSMNFRWKPNHYINGQLNFSYLISHLDGIDYLTVQGIINRSKNADMSGAGAWILDDDPTLSFGHEYFNITKNTLEDLDFNVYFDDSNKWITSYQGSVMGYMSWGTHAEDGNQYWEDSAWVVDSLHFNLSNGAVFNTFESFNGNSLTTLKWRYNPSVAPDYNHTQGLATQFTQIGGTATMGHAWEPVLGGIVNNTIFFPSYQIGYNLIDAVYLGMSTLAFQNVVVGDPLTRIMNYEIKTLASDSTITTSGDFIGRLVVPAGKRLTVQSGVTLNFNRNSSLQISGILEVQQGATLNFNSYSSLVFNTGSTNQNLNGVFNFRKKARMELKNDFTLTNSSSFNFFDNGFLTATKLTIASGEFLIFYDNSILTVDTLNISPGATLNFYGQSGMKITSSLSAVGNELNKIHINTNNLYAIKVEEARSVDLEYLIIRGGGLQILASSLFQNVVIEINKVNFVDNINFGIAIYGQNANYSNRAFISNTSIRGDIKHGIQVFDLNDLEIVDVLIMDTLAGNQTEATSGISAIDCPNVRISNCATSTFDFGISLNERGRPEEQNNDQYLLLTGNELSNCKTGIYLNNLTNGFAEISKNNIYLPTHSANEITSAVVINNSNEINIESNTIYDYDYGIFLSFVDYPNLLDNKIQVLNQSNNVQSGIFSNSGKGMYRLNLITGYKRGIELGNSYPLIGQNIITENTETGIYVGPNSLPDLSRGYIQKEEAMREFPISGLNHISNNGGLCSYDPYDGAEIYIADATIDLSHGCNTIEDNRLPNEYVCNTQKLLIAKAKGEDIFAELNYWGNHPEYGHNPAERIFSDVQVFFEPYNEEPCIKNKDDKFIVLMDSRKTHVIDTIYSYGTITSYDSLTNEYALAAKHFFDGNLTEAKQIYNNIIQLYGLNRKSIEAYTKLYTISKLTNASSTMFNELKNYYEGKLTSIQDTLLFKVVKHLRDLCLVATQDYTEAIDNFSEVITLNQNSEEAFFAAIDILTTSLLDTGITALGKVGGMDLSAKDADDYRAKLNLLLKVRNNKESIITSKVIPAQFSLYQNYPNPFNPTTKIQYDIPTDTKVQLKIYDVLGREVKTLVNEFQNAGRYNVEFNASNFASGVYFYRIVANNFVRTKKLMILR